MPINLLKYGLALASIAVIAYFSIRVIAAKLKKAGILKHLRFGKKKEVVTEEKKEEKEWIEPKQ